jgi:hypothetical protein
VRSPKIGLDCRELRFDAGTLLLLIYDSESVRGAGAATGVLNKALLLGI